MFTFENFSCDTDIFHDGDNLVVRFFSSDKEHREDEIINFVVVDSGFGFISLKFKGDSGLLSGYLKKSVFNTEEMVEAAIEFTESQSPLSKNIYIPHHVDLVELKDYVEYNGEY